MIKAVSLNRDGFFIVTFFPLGISGISKVSLFCYFYMMVGMSYNNKT